METCRMSRKGQRMERSRGEEENGPFKEQRSAEGPGEPRGDETWRGQEMGEGPDRRACRHCEGCMAAKSPSSLPDGKALGEVEKANIRWATKQSCFCTLMGQDTSKVRSPPARAGLGSCLMCWGSRLPSTAHLLPPPLPVASAAGNLGPKTMQRISGRQGLRYGWASIYNSAATATSVGLWPDLWWDSGKPQSQTLEETAEEGQMTQLKGVEPAAPTLASSSGPANPHLCVVHTNIS
ncbi:PREDICTED: uncharacterized protein LOC108513950 [Rhinopithecus bieti]|uniref:uncharacterized protein LOC108513950 n=1 Tax=Rhinopithecus bieti TaxID=61621 RepID=UPI00083C2D7D|nr:PREDICTED: uncharacterized protein LOC108513950 [Rhinopithecus bieti]XP_017705421.1 PREDICTED: uncharacterized protein LOC108513950 [Rhinopithecus bieti]XP_017705422.1 PREDICTED: uncharacterized protein LOC108513950 [Rhinopithecus bieti]